jgi:hypothetical protein
MSTKTRDPCGPRTKLCCTRQERPASVKQRAWRRLGPIGLSRHSSAASRRVPRRSGRHSSTRSGGIRLASPTCGTCVRLGTLPASRAGVLLSCRRLEGLKAPRGVKPNKTHQRLPPRGSDNVYEGREQLMCSVDLGVERTREDASVCDLSLEADAQRV